MGRSARRLRHITPPKREELNYEAAFDSSNHCGNGGCRRWNHVGIRVLLITIIDRRIARFQSSLIEKQMTETENMYRQMRSWRHDYRNHIQNMKILLSEGNYSELDTYMEELAKDLVTVDTVIKTGNVMADAVLNAKLYAANNLHVRFNVKANIPKNLPMSDVELCAVLGNLLDNALESCARLSEEERFIRIFIGIIKGQFYLSVQNAAREIKKKGEGYLSTKEQLFISHTDFLPAAFATIFWCCIKDGLWSAARMRN